MFFLNDATRILNIIVTLWRKEKLYFCSEYTVSVFVFYFHLPPALNVLQQRNGFPLHVFTALNDIPNKTKKWKK